MPSTDAPVPLWARAVAVLQSLFLLSLLCYAWALFLSPQSAALVSHALPKPLKWFSSDWTRLIPPHAKSRGHAWELGVVQGRLGTLIELSGNNSVEINETIGRAIELLTLAGATNVTLEPSIVLATLNDSFTSTIESDLKIGPAAKLKRFFSLTNTLWLIGILGLFASLLPVLQLLLPVLAGLLLGLYYLLKPIVKLAWRIVIFYLASSIFASAGDASINTDVRVYSLITAALASSLTGAYTLMVLSFISYLPQHIIEPMSYLVGSAIFAPLAMIVGSKLLGFFCVALLFAALGVGIRAIPGGYLIGFQTSTALDRSLLSSALILLLSVFSNLYHLEFLAPFQQALQIFGSSTLYLALLIRSSSILHGFSTHYAVTMLISLFLGLLSGTLLDIPGISNTALVFSYLFALDSIIWLGGRGSFWIGIFIGSAGLVVGALAVHKNPEVVAALWEG